MKSGTSTSTSIHPLRLPHPGSTAETHVEGELTAWFAEPGENLRTGQLLFEVTWPGIVIEYQAPASGRLLKQHAGLRQRLLPEQIICELALQQAESAPTDHEFP